MNKSGFIYGAIILTIVNFIVRFIGFSYKIILSKLIGPEGIGLFQIVSPVLMFFITFTTAGIPIAVSKIVAAQNSLRDSDGCKKVLRSALLLAFSISSIFIAILIIFGEYISLNILKNEDVYYLVLMLAPSIMIISISSVMRGYFYGLKRISPAGIAQIIEQLTRIIFVLAVIYYLKPVSPKHGALVAVIGIGIGEIFGLLWLVFHYKLRSKSPKSFSRKKQSYIEIFSKICYIAAPITVSRIIGVVMQLANAVLIPQKLVEAGYTAKEAISIFGRVMGMTMPIIFLPFIVTSALVVNIIPNLAEEFERKRFEIIRNNIALAIRITLLMSIPLTSIYILFSNPIAMVLYNDGDVGRYMSILGLSTIFFSLQHILSGILHGIGRQIPATVNNLIGMCFQLFSTFVLVSNPSYGINGFFIGFIASSFIICTLDFISLSKVISIRISLKDYVIKPILASVFSMMCMTIIYLHSLNNGFKGYAILLSSLSIGMLVYFSCLFFLKAVPPYFFKKLFNFRK